LRGGNRDKVKDWIVLNEPFALPACYYAGRHAPGRIGLSNFLPAIHHAALAQAEGGRILRQLVKNAHIGTSFPARKCAPYKCAGRHPTAKRVDILMNRLFIEPALGGVTQGRFQIPRTAGAT